MPSLRDAYDDAAGGSPARRLYLGAGLLFVGIAVAVPGLVRVTTEVLAMAGVGEPTARWGAVAVAGLAVPMVGAGLLAQVPSSRRLRAVGAAGVLLSTAAVAGFLAAVSPEALAGVASVPWPIVLAYAAGAMLALWSPVVTAGLVATDTREQAVTTTAFVRDASPARPRGRVPADGGKEEEQLAFLLDRDEK